MKYEIKNRYNDSIIYQDEAESFSALVQAAVKAKVSLDNASLVGASLDCANLCNASLHDASLDNASLDNASLVGASLDNASLVGASLRNASLRHASLRNASLDNASLVGASLPAPTVVLLANWGELTNELTADLMEFDAASHPNREAFELWAKGGQCPYEGVLVQRSANFIEKKELWGKGKVTGVYALMVRVLEEKTRGWK